MSEWTDLLLQVFPPVQALLFIVLSGGGYLAFRSISKQVERTREDLAGRIDAVQGRVRRLEDSHIPDHPDYQRRAQSDD
ncbi:hypothetical protein SAMN05216388_1001224 [Halorientalis persicus]|uniref:Uncharacterized protein n=1 Tax=Halorientalis persicus TaxID=1367881 RepID=A0A1H8D9U9_9EURY|nr:hypothetical protein [Halorientalis persicus]SEN04063.1 hypothetical protein SAMN05216388_1001224 [Halorientalis persicus]